MNREEYWQYIEEALADKWELLTYCEEETNPHKDYKLEHELSEIDMPF